MSTACPWWRTTRKSIEIKKQQLESLEAAVEFASKLFQNARVEYVEVLFAQRDLLDARMVLIETKKEQLSAIVNAYQALGGGVPPILLAETAVILPPLPHHSGPPSPVGPPRPAARPLPRRAAAAARTAGVARAGKLTGPGKASDGSRAAASTTLNIESLIEFRTVPRRGPKPDDARTRRASPGLLLVQRDLGLHAPKLDVIYFDYCALSTLMPSFGKLLLLFQDVVGHSWHVLTPDDHNYNSVSPKATASIGADWRSKFSSIRIRSGITASRLAVPISAQNLAYSQSANH